METLILEINTRGLHRYQQIDREVTTIGRALDNDIILSDPTVAPHHLRIIRHADDSIELVNLTQVNPVRINGERVDSLVTGNLPLNLELGRVQAQLLPRDFAVSATRPLAGNGPSHHLFGRAYWAVLLVIACLVVGGLDFYLNSHNSFKWSDLLKYVLRETVLGIGAFVLALSILERLLVNRWEIKQLVISVCLLFLLFSAVNVLADGLAFLFSASWPSTLIHFGWYLVIIPYAITLYLIYISHFRRARSILLACLIASPIALPAILQSSELRMLLDDFSSSAQYQNRLSSLNWHLGKTVAIERFIDQAQNLEPGEFAD